MLREESADPEVVRQAKRIGEAANRCAAIVKTSLTMSHDETSETGHDPPSGRLRIVVEDNGPDVPPQVARKIFEPFFSTRCRQGHGVGLTWCNRVVEGHGGQIWLDTEFRDGACFVIELPAPNTEVAKDTVARERRNRAVRILVIDDEPDVADLNGEVLKRVGYAVTVVHSGADALDALSG